VKLVISGAQEGLQAGVAKVLKTTWQRCVQFIRNALAYANKVQRQAVLAMINTIVAQEKPNLVRAQWRSEAEQLCEKLPKLTASIDSAEQELLASMSFPRSHRAQTHSTNPLEQLNAEVKRRTNVLGIFPNERAIIDFVGAMTSGRCSGAKCSLKGSSR
jgi:putative transposase